MKKKVSKVKKPGSANLGKWKDYRLSVMEIALPEDLDNNMFPDRGHLNDDDFLAKIDNDDIEIQGEKSVVGNDNYDSHASDFNIIFSIEFEYRSWGVKGIYLNAKKAIGSVFVTIWGDPEDKEIEIDCNEFELETEKEIDSDTITINSLVIDIENKKIICS